MLPGMTSTELRLAQDPNTSAGVLRRLAHGSDPRVQAAVASNPNVPPDVFWELAVPHPDAVLLNPSFELFALEDALWLQRPEPRVVVDLMLHPKAPGWFVEQVIAGLPAARMRLAHFAKDPDLLWRLVRRYPADKQLLATVVRNRHTSPSLLEHLAVECGLLGVVLQKEQNVPAYFLEAALEAGRFEDPAGQRALTGLSHLPEHQLERLAASPHALLRRAVARSPALSEALLERLARDPSPEVREEVARHARCPKALAQRIQRDLPPRPVLQPLKP